MLVSLFSQERLKNYGYGEDSETLVLDRYKWNIALSEALYPSLSLLEVALRNRIDGAFIEMFGQDWLDENSENWVRTQRMIQNNFPNPERDAIVRAKQSLIRNGQAVTHAKLLAELNFGFWVNLFKAHYHPLFWQKKSKPMGKVFRGTPKLPPKEAFDQLQRVKNLRNRIAHHEAIWRKTGLYQDYVTICKLLKALEPALSEIASDMDRFSEIWSHQP